MINFNVGRFCFSLFINNDIIEYDSALDTRSSVETTGRSHSIIAISVTNWQTECNNESYIIIAFLWTAQSQIFQTADVVSYERVITSQKHSSVACFV